MSDLAEAMKKIVRNMSDETGKAFWASAEKTAAPVKDWPAWKKGGIDVRQSGITPITVTPDDGRHWRRKTSLLAIDPGAKTGWALFLEPGGWHLAACGVVSPKDPPTWPGVKNLDQVVIEDPVIYPHSRVRPASLMTLARIVGRYEERFAHAKAIELVAPRSWKGSVKKEIMLVRIESGLSAADRSVAQAYTGGYRDNMLDAIGLGVWALKQPFMVKDR